MEYAVDSHVFVLSPKMNISGDACIFITTILSQYAQIFGHGRANSLSRIKRERFMLPVADDGEPDWRYMERYTRGVLSQQTSSYLDYLDKRMEKI